jgi:glutathione S-transferase
MTSSTPAYFPTATGEAAATVQEHAGPAPIKMWAGWFCPFTQRTWVALEEKGVPYQYHEVNPYLKEEAFLSEQSRKISVRQKS